jgi:hypothetical protein
VHATIVQMTHPIPRLRALLAGASLAAFGAASIAQAPSGGDAPAAHPPRIDATSPDCRPQRPAAVPAGVDGETTIWYELSAKGRVNSAEIHHSAGPTREHRLLDNAARNAFVRCPFMPGRDANGAAIGGITVVTWSWRSNQVLPPEDAASGTPETH